MPLSAEDTLDSPLGTVICEKAFFDAVFINSPTGIILADATGRFLDANEACAHILGYSRSELVGKTFQELTHQEDILFDMQMFNQLLRGIEDSYEMTKRFIAKSGHVVWVHIRVNAVKEDHRLTHLVKHILQIEPHTQPCQVAVSDMLRDPLVKRYILILFALLIFSTVSSVLSLFHILGHFVD
jgi:PAS domain S-box-containing protein